MKRLSLLVIPFFLISCASKTAKVEETKLSPAPVKKADEKERIETPAPSPAPTAKKKAKAPEQAETKPVAEGGVTCKQGGTTRTIEVKKADGGGCEVMYDRGDGTANSVANAKNDVTHCENVKNKIKTNLEGAGYQCE